MAQSLWSYKMAKKIAQKEHDSRKFYKKLKQDINAVTDPESKAALNSIVKIIADLNKRIKELEK